MPYFPHRYFSVQFFPARYFPGEVAASTDSADYFPHRYFPLAFFPDRYFPGAEATAPEPETPPSIVGVGGGVRPPIRRRHPDITARLRLVLAAFEGRLRGTAAPADASAALDLRYAFELLANAEIAAADMQGLNVSVDLAAFLVSLTASPSAPARKRLDDDEELLEHYLACLALRDQ